MRLKFFPALRAVISLFLIGLLIFIRRDSLDQTISAIRGAHFPVVAGAIALFFTTIFTLAYRLKTVLKAKKIRLKFLEVVKLTFTGFFFNNFLPTAVGGDVVKGYYLYKNTGDKLNSFISIVMDRFIGFFTLFLMASVSLIFSHSYVQNKTLIFFTVGILLLLTIMLVVLFNKKAARAFRFFSPLAERMGIKEKIERSYNTINGPAGIDNSTGHRFCSRIFADAGARELYIDKNGLFVHAARIYNSSLTVNKRPRGARVGDILPLRPLCRPERGARTGAIMAFYALFGQHYGWNNLFTSRRKNESGGAECLRYWSYTGRISTFWETVRLTYTAR